MVRETPRKRTPSKVTRANRRTAPALRRHESGAVQTSRQPRLGWNRFAARARQLGKPLGILLLLGVVGYGGVLAHRFVLESPHFHVKKVEVTPTVHVTADEVRALAGIGPRTNVFTVGLATVARRVERHPWVARALVRRRLPDAIRIEITEHQAVAAVLLDGPDAPAGAFYLVTSEGRAFKRARLAELEGLPLVTGIARREYRARPAEGQARIREALAVARHYQARSGRPKLGEVHVDPIEGVTLYTASRVIQLRLGRGQVATKLRRLDLVLGALAARGQQPRAIRLDNTRHPKRVTVSLAEATGPERP